MKRTSLWLRSALISAVALVGVACTDGPADLNDNPATPAQPSDPADPIDPPTHPSDVVINSDAFLKVTGAGGGEIVASSDGSVLLEVRAGQFDNLSTVAFHADVLGGEIADWSRVDDFLKSSGGSIISLESRVEGQQLRIISGTTVAVSGDGEAGEPIARLRVVPTADTVSISLVASGKDLGFVNATGERLSVNIIGADFARSGS